MKKLELSKLTLPKDFNLHASSRWPVAFLDRNWESENHTVTCDFRSRTCALHLVSRVYPKPDRDLPKGRGWRQKLVDEAVDLYCKNWGKR